MGISKLLGLMAEFFHNSDLQHDDLLDSLIRDALLDDAAARPSRDAWDRLRQVIVERQRRHYGMWVLDEPQHDPPIAPPMLLNGPVFDHARRIHNGRQFAIGHNLGRNVFWVGMAPAFTVMANW